MNWVYNNYGNNFSLQNLTIFLIPKDLPESSYAQIDLKMYDPIHVLLYRKIHYLTREFRVKLHAKTNIARIAKRWVRYRFSSAI